MSIVREPKARGIVFLPSAEACVVDLRADGTADCETCHMPMFPIAIAGESVTMECANRHRVAIPQPESPKMRRFVKNWVARKGAQLHEQHERWEKAKDDGE